MAERMFERRDFDGSYPALCRIAPCLAELAPKMVSEQRARSARLLFDFFPVIGFGGEMEPPVKSLASVLGTLDGTLRDELTTSVMTLIVDYSASALSNNVNYGECDFESSSFVASSMSNPRSVARLLSHPGCVGKPRQFLLQRFEELLFHDGKPVFLTKPESETEAQPSQQPKPEPPSRRFHNLHDAAAWIQQNWPDFDLETNHPVTWRGEPK